MNRLQNRRGVFPYLLTLLLHHLDSADSFIAWNIFQLLQIINSGFYCRTKQPPLTWILVIVLINNATDKKIESLRKAFQLSRSSLLEFAVNYHEQTNQYRTEQNQQQLNKDTKASLTSKNSGPIKNLDELRRARQQSIEHQTEHPQSQISTNEQLTATQKSIDGEKAQITNPQLSVNNNELKNTEQLERHPKPAKDEPMLEHSQLTEAEQPLETLNQGSKPHTQHIMDKLRRQKQQKEKNRKKNKNRKVKR